MSALAHDLPPGQLAPFPQPTCLRPPAIATLQLPFHRLSVQVIPVDLWGCRVDDLPADLLANPVSLSVLSPAEQHRLRALSFHRDRLRYLAGRLLLRSILSQYTGIPPQDLKFVHNAFGRPELAASCTSRSLSGSCSEAHQAGVGALRFNLSRAGSLVVLAVSSGGEVGVDVEDEERRISAEEVAPGALAERELAVFHRSPQHLRHGIFLRYWVLKEAYVKALGVGLSLDVRRVCFTPPGRGPVRVRHDGDMGGDATRWRFALLRLDERYPTALAYRDPALLAPRLQDQRLRGLPRAGEAGRHGWSRTGRAVADA